MLAVWQSLARIRPSGRSRQHHHRQAPGHPHRGSIIRTSERSPGRTLGLNDTIVVHTPDATLVADKHQEEAIRELVKALEDRGWREYL